jgi:hypothetical protein
MPMPFSLRLFVADEVIPLISAMVGMCAIRALSGRQIHLCQDLAHHCSYRSAHVHRREEQSETRHFTRTRCRGVTEVHQE